MLVQGDRVPEIVNFIGREGDIAPEGGCPIGGKFVYTSSEEIFKGKRVIVFALPGAWTPTCSSQQLPGFENMYERFKDQGIDEIYCLSMNDGFVMNAWFEKEGIKNVKPLCDGNGDFTALMGMKVEKSNLGFGFRSWRYAMIVKNGVIEAMFAEPGIRDDADDDAYAISSPENVMRYLDMI